LILKYFKYYLNLSYLFFILFNLNYCKFILNYNEDDKDIAPLANKSGITDIPSAYKYWKALNVTPKSYP